MSTRGHAEPIRAAVYLRISLDRAGDHLAVDRQREDCLRIIAERGWTLADEYVDNSVSASDKTKDRPGYNRMVDDFHAGRFEALVCYDLDRLTRQPRQLEDWVDAAEERGLKLVTANGEADLATDAGRLFARIKAAVARAEVERKSARQARAARQRSEKGRPPLGVRLTGYTTAGDIVPDEADVVRLIFDRFTRGDSLHGIVRVLEDKGIATRTGRPWNPSSVRTILTNPRYAGLAVYQGKPTGQRGDWPALVSEDVWSMIQSRLADPRRKTAKTGTERRHLGSGLFLCGQCGHPVTAWTGDRYRCRPCRLSRTQAHVDPYVLAFVRERLADPRLAAQMIQGDAAEVDELARRADDLRARLATIEADYDAGLIDGRRYAAATERAAEELRQVGAERSRHVGNSAIAGTLLAPDPVASFDAESLMVRRAVVDALVSVRLLRGQRGSRAFDPESVIVEPKGV